jgi:hypothetical protein
VSHTLFFCPCCTNAEPTNFKVSKAAFEEVDGEKDHPIPKRVGIWDAESIAVPEVHANFKMEWTHTRKTENFVRAFKAHLKEHWETHHSWGFYISAEMTKWAPPAISHGPVEAPNFHRVAQED